MRRAISLSLIASSMMFGHSLVFNIDSLENMDIVKEKLDSIKTFIDSNYFDKRALSPLVGGSGDINDTAKDGVGYIIYYPYSEPNLNGYNKLVEECESDGCEDLTTTGCGDGEFYDGSQCVPYSCENGYGGDPYDGDIGCSDKGLTKLSEGWLNLKSVDGYLYLDNNNLTDISNLINLTRINDSYNGLNLDGNNLTSLHGLENLTYAGYDFLNVRYNQLTSLDGLHNLLLPMDLLFNNNNISDISVFKNYRNSLHTTYYDGAVTLNLNNNNLSNLEGIKEFAEMENCDGGNYVYIRLINNPIDDLSIFSSMPDYCGLGWTIYIDEKEYSSKVSNDSYMCQNFDSIVYNENGNKWDPSHKSWICE